MRWVLLGLVVGLVIMIPATALDLSDWKYYREIIIKENSGKDLIGYQVLIELNSANFDFSKTKADGSDIRFVDVSGNELPYWIEEWNYGKAKIWVKIPHIPANGETKIYMYYGNPNAVSKSNGNAVFEFFEDWSKDPEVNGWRFRSDDPTVKISIIKRVPGKYIVFHCDGCRFKHGGYINKTIRLSTKELSIEGKFNTDDGSDHGIYVYIPEKMCYGGRTGTPSGYPTMNQICLCKCGHKDLDFSFPFNKDIYLHYSWYKSSSYLKIYTSEKMAELRCSYNPEFGENAVIKIVMGGYTHGDDLNVRWYPIKIRKYTNPEPTVIIKAEQPTIPPTPKPKLILTIECDPILKQGEIRLAKLTAENIGNTDAKNAKITITSPSLGINVQKSYDVIPSKEARTITFQVSPTEAGKFKITAMAEYWDDQGNKYIETAEKVIEVEPVTFPSPTTVTSTVIKKPPIAMVGEDVKVYEGSEVILSALASYDPDGTIVSYCWIDENDVTLSNSPILRYFFPVGTHMITLKVTDNDGLSSTDTVRVTVLAKEKGKPMIVVSQSSISGEEGLYTVTITNTGDSQAYNIRVIERIPSEIVVSYVEGAMSSGSLITWNGDLKPNEQHSIKHSLKLQTDQAIIPVTVRYKDENGMEYELLTNLLVQKPTKQTIPPSTPQLPISEQTLIIITAIVVVGVVAVAVAIAMMKRKPPEIQIRE